MCGVEVLPAYRSNSHPGRRHGSECWKLHGRLASHVVETAQYVLSGTGVGERECAGEDKPASAHVVAARTCTADVEPSVSEACTSVCAKSPVRGSKLSVNAVKMSE